MPGSTNFPGALDGASTLPDFADPNVQEDDPGFEHDDLHANVNVTLLAIQAKLGVDGSAVPASIDYRVGALESGKIGLAEKGIADGVATLGSDGKIPGWQLPALAISSVHVVASEAEQLALSVQEGDVAVRTDVGSNWIHNGGTSGTMSDWTALVGSGAVSSVAGKTGAVVLEAADIASGVFAASRLASGTPAEGDVPIIQSGGGVAWGPQSGGGGGGGSSTTEGAYWELPASPAEGDLHFLTDAPAVMRRGASAWSAFGPVRNLTPPDTSAFTWGNRGDQNVRAARPFPVLDSGGTGSNLRYLKIAAPAAPWTMTFGALIHGVGGQLAGATIGVRNTGTGRMVAMLRIGPTGPGTADPSLVQVSRWNSHSSFSSAVATFGAVPSPCWLRIVNDGTNLRFFSSSDGFDWQQIHSETLATWISSVDEMTLGPYANGTMPVRLTLLHWSVDASGLGWNPAQTASSIDVPSGSVYAHRFAGAAWMTSKAHVGRSTGKYVFAVRNAENGATNGSLIVGLADAALSAGTQYTGQTASSFGLHANRSAGRLKYNNGATSAITIAEAAIDDYVMVAADLDTGDIWFGVAGSWSGDPAAGTGAAFTYGGGLTLYPAVSLYSNPQSIEGAFTADAYPFAVPSGFSAWLP